MNEDKGNIQALKKEYVKEIRTYLNTPIGQQRTYEGHSMRIATLIQVVDDLEKLLK